MRLPPLNALRAFETAARLGSFTLAGKELHVTHGAISQQIRILETSLGVMLFIRHGNRIELTMEGMAIYEIARRGLKSLEEIPQILRQGDMIKGEVILSAPPGFAGHWLTHQLAGFHKQYPDLRLRVIPSNDDREIQSRDVDICIRYGNGAWPGRTVELLSDIYLFPVCSPQLLETGKTLETPADLRQFPILCADDGYEWDSWLGSIGMTDDLSDQRHYLGNALNTTEACRYGFGVALCGSISSAHYLQQGQLVRPFRQSVRTSNSLFIITRDDIVHKAGAAATVGWFRNKFAQQVPVD
ncbi:LysR substrate-binding domain-containing protein [Aquamicrobium terrae]|uniref:LysR family glycine cleavage system transcriptional activator n=1 Tax=Aquamicrobium terrae TaxID=1324945 RepID=A0ABV2N2G2_9HYPH